MDRTLKERIIGAIVLVVFVVLVVPIFLDGPPGEGEIVTETVTLPGQSEQKMQTRVLERNRSTPEPKEPEPKEDSSSGRETAIAMAPAQNEDSRSGRKTAIDAAPTPEDTGSSVPETATEPPPEPKETSATGMYAVQLGAFSDQAKADKLAADLRKQGFAAFLTRVSTDKGQLHRVRIGPQADRAAAEAVAKKLDSSGHTSRVVPHP